MHRHKGGGGLKLDELNTQETINRNWSSFILTLFVFFCTKGCKKNSFIYQIN